jgi:hypothetical protein
VIVLIACVLLICLPAPCEADCIASDSPLPLTKNPAVLDEALRRIADALA